MAIQRQSTKSGLSAGNFGKAGTPLASIHQPKGPNLDRLARSLGVGIESAVGKQQAEDTDAAKAAVQEALLKTKNSSPEERAQVLGNVRAQFEDQSLFMKLFTDENPAVQAMDKITGLAKANETKQALLAASEQNKHLSLEEQQEIQAKILQDSAMFSKGISEGTNNAFLDSITQSALVLDEQISNRYAERVKVENVAKVSDTYYKLGNDYISGAIQVSPEAMATDIDAHTLGRESFKNNLVGIKVNVAKQAQEQFNTILDVTKGDKIAAGKATVDYVVSLAKQYSAPELLDILNDKSVKAKNKQALGTFYNKQITKAKIQITDQLVHKEESLRLKKEQEHKQAIAADYNQSSIELTELHDAWKDSPEDTVLLNNYRSAIDEHQAHLQINQESWVGNEDAYLQRDKLLKYHKSLITPIEGSSDPLVFDKLMTSMNMGELTLDKVIANQHLLSIAQRSEIDAGMRKQAEMPSEAARLDERYRTFKQIQVSTASGIELDSDSSIFKENYKDHIDLVDEAVKPQILQALSVDYTSLATEAMKEWRSREGKWFSLNVDDQAAMQSYVEGVMKPHREKFLAATKIVTDGVTKRKDENDANLNNIIDVATSNDDLDTSQATFVLENQDRIKLLKGKEVAKSAITGAIRSNIRSEVAKGRTKGIIDKAILAILKENPLDLSQEKEAKEFINILGASLEDLETKRRVTRSEGEFGDKVLYREENLGDYIRDTFSTFLLGDYHELIQTFKDQGLTDASLNIPEMMLKISKDRKTKK